MCCFQTTFVPKTKLNIGKRAFSVATRAIWNQLPVMIKSSETIDTFRNKLEKYFEFVPCCNDDFCLSLCMTS